MDRSTKIAWGITIAAIAAGVWMKLRERSDGGSVIFTGRKYYPEYDMRVNENLPRGYRNNNPLNIDYYNSYGKMANDWVGQVGVEPEGRFAQFVDMAYGYRAALILLRNYIKLYGLNTIRKIIGRWAPPDDHNDTESYIRNVSKLTGISADTVISPSDKDKLTKIVYAMSISENGYKDLAKPANDIKEHYDLPNMNIINEGWRII